MTDLTTCGPMCDGQHGPDEPHKNLLRFNVTCPVCGELLHPLGGVEMGLWGTVSLTDIGCAEVTLPGTVVNDHMRVHQEDGTYLKKLREHWQRHADHAAEAVDRLTESIDRWEASR